MPVKAHLSLLLSEYGWLLTWRKPPAATRAPVVLLVLTFKAARSL